MSWMITFPSMVMYRFWIKGDGKLFCFLLFQTMVNSLSLLLLRDEIFPAHIRPQVWGLWSINSTGCSRPNAVQPCMFPAW